MHDDETSAEPATTASSRFSSASRQGRLFDTTDLSLGRAPRRSSKPPRLRSRRFRVRELLDRGGMGEIHAAHDARIGRSVVVKVLREEADAQPNATPRFLREARVQGQLEHPAIVPVYDLGAHASGRPFFAMKRIGGVTMDEVLRRLAEGDPATVARFSRRRLLAAFQQVCLAVDYAHVRGVVHRDLKPSNLMLGDFGEVYVLDWGIAKVSAEAARARRAGDGEATVSGPLALEDGEDDATQDGDVLGTIGYMAPEQLASASAADARSDVYSLGALLFHLLTLEPLHGRGPQRERAVSTHAGADARASVRAPDRGIPPELDAICVKATALGPGDRYPTTRALHDAIERFLEGDRDLRLRAELAAHHVESAREAAEQARRRGEGSVEARRRAIGEAGRALALDPENDDAAAILGRLMLEPPGEIPPEVQESTERTFQRDVLHGARMGAFALLGFAALTSLLSWMGVRSWIGLGLIAAPLVVAAVGLLLGLRRSPERYRPLSLVAALPLCIAIGASGGIAGPLFLTPLFGFALAVVVTVLTGLGPYRFWLLAMVAASVIAPTLLEWAGVLPRAYAFDGGVLTVIPQLAELPEVPARVSLLVVNVATIALVCGLLLRFAGEIARSRQRAQLHAWHLAQLTPRAKRDSWSARDHDRE